MHATTNILQLTAAALALVNIWVSISVFRSSFYSPGQKFAQCLIVWLIPLVGVIGVWLFLRSQYSWQKYDTRAYPERSEKMVPLEIDHAIHDNFGDGGHGGGD